jgi:uncharacterized protein with GYD domain
MPHYVVLFDWTDQGVKSARDTVDRVSSATGLAQDKYGVTIGQVYWTVGAHDLVGFMEAPDVESLSAFLLELGSAGNVRSTTMRAFDRDEMSQILGMIG